jgi:hypothetical protein
VTIFGSVSLVAAVLALTVVPVFVLDGGRDYCTLLVHHPIPILVLAGVWSALLSWFLRRVAEFALLRRSGAKLDADA